MLARCLLLSTFISSETQLSIFVGYSKNSQFVKPNRAFDSV